MVTQDYDIQILPILNDNFIFIIIHRSTNNICVVDPGEPEKLIFEIQKNSWNLKQIWITHHHQDHTGGLEKLKNIFNPQIFANLKDQNRVSLATNYLNEDGEFGFESLKIKTISLDGHTLGHFGFYVPELKSLFSGDVIFSLGCGRLFEGSYEQLYSSLNKIKNLPDSTLIYFAHEYTIKNYQFTKSIDSDNVLLERYIHDVQARLSLQIPSVPTTLGEQKKINLFLRLDDNNVKSKLNMISSSELKILKKLRELRNEF